MVKTMDASHGPELSLNPPSPAFGRGATARKADPSLDELQLELERLAEENADLRGSARIWIRMYEQLLAFYWTQSLTGIDPH
jgi:hypothetical protein